MTDYRLATYRREVFLRSWELHLQLRAHPGTVHQLLPAIAEGFEVDENGRAWLVWLNGHCENPAMSLLLMEASEGRPEHWKRAVDFWNDNWSSMRWDIDRRHQKGSFGTDTEKMIQRQGTDLISGWNCHAALGWEDMWSWARGPDFPSMGRMSAWSMVEYASILLGNRIPDASSLLLGDSTGSRSHRNGLAVVSGYDAAYWGWEEASGIVGDLEELGEELLAAMSHPEASRLNLESALCTYKSWHKPNRRYPNVYSDMAYYRIRFAEKEFGNRFRVLWRARQHALPEWARLEDNPLDPGLVPAKQNHYLLTGQPVMLGHVWPEYWSDFDTAVNEGRFGVRHD